VTNFWIQIQTLLVREFQLIGGDKGAIFSKVFSVLSKAFIYATAYLLLDLDVDGAFSRGGAIFISVLFNSLVRFLCPCLFFYIFKIFHWF
jgi:ATP-binding cassette subfamily G (WHITE) protein 2 (SNQ2)